MADARVVPCRRNAVYWSVEFGNTVVGDGDLPLPAWSNTNMHYAVRDEDGELIVRMVAHEDPGRAELARLLGLREPAT